MSVNKEVFLSVAPKLLSSGFQITPIYHNDPNLDFKELKIFKKGWNSFDNPLLVRTEDDLQKIDWGRFLCYLTLPSPGTVILDVDTKTPEQTELAREFMSDMKALKAPNTFMVNTPSGGVHLYYYTEDRINASKFGDCVDIQQAVPGGASAQGCYGPGCQRKPGLSYGIIKDEAIAVLPNNIANWLSVKVDAVDTSLTKAPGIDLFPDSIPRGDRDNVISGIAASLVKRGLGARGTLEQLKIIRDSSMEGPEDFSDELLKEKVARVIEKKGFQPDDRGDVDILHDRLVFLTHGSTIFDKVDLVERPLNKAIPVYAKYKYETETKSGGISVKKAFNAWLEDKMREEAFQISYLPGEGEIWTDPTNGNIHCNNYRSPIHTVPKEDQTKYIEAFTQLCAHLYPDDPEFFLHYAAYFCQDERNKLDFMVILISEIKGIGKNLYSEILTNLLGSSNVKPASVKDLTDTFNSDLVDKRLIVIDEMESVFHKKDIGAVKSMITAVVINRNEKFIPARTQKVSFSFLGFSNRDDTHVIEHGDRRFTILRSPSGKLPSDLMKVVSEMASNKSNNRVINQDAVNGLWYHLKEIEVDKKKFSNTALAMETSEKDDIRVQSMYGLAQDFAQMVQAKEGPFAGDVYTIQMVQYYYYYAHGEIPKRVEVKKALRDAGAMEPLRLSGGATNRQVQVYQIDLTPPMQVQSIKHKTSCYVCRNIGDYPPGCDIHDINVQLLLGYDAIKKINPYHHGTTDNVTHIDEALKI